MKEIIKTKDSLCTGCNKCVRTCPMEMANITYQDESGNIKVKIDHEKCITCGRCFSACKHGARYYDDDTLRFFSDLSDGVPISLIAAPAIRTNLPDYKRLFTYLKQLGVRKIYDVSLGADICIWAHIRHLEKSDPQLLITQPCPAIVQYCEIYRHDLLTNLSPIHSPMGCLSVYMKEQEGIKDRIAALSPCVAKSIEFADTELTQYNITFSKLRDYLEANNITLPEEETGFDHAESGIGSLFPMPGGLKENIEFFFDKKFSIDRAEGNHVYDYLNMYAHSSTELLPQIFDVLNCEQGCNIGTACIGNENIFGINRVMDVNREAVMNSRDKKATQAVYQSYDNTLDMSHFTRKYQPVFTDFPRITDEDIEKAFALLGKTNDEKRNVDCGACGSETCLSMAKKIALDVNIPINCIVKTMEDAKKEHDNNLAAREQLAKVEQMREADDRMRAILEATPFMNILFDSRYQAIDCNPAAIAFAGFPTKEKMLAEFLGWMSKSIPVFQSNGQPSVSIGERLIAAARDSFVKFETEIFVDGIMRDINVEFRKIPYGSSFAIVCYIFDITDIHERELELLRARELNELQLMKLDLTVRASKIGLWDMEIVQGDPVNPANTFMWSDEFRRMLGYTNESDFPNILSSWSGKLHPEDQERTLRAFEKHLLDKTGQSPYDVEYRLQKKNGEYAHFQASGETIRDEDGNALRVAGALVDITERKTFLLDIEKQRAEAEAANRAKSNFLSTMSHEIRTPMNAILGLTEIQLQDETLDENTRDVYEKIYVSGDMLLGIINDILDLSKIEAGKMELIYDKYEIASLISDTAQLNMMRIGSKNIHFEVDVDENIPLNLLGDELRVKQILNNLLSNAFKYTEAGKVKLEVSAGTAGEDDMILIFSISDTGQGMTKEQVDKLFDEYSQFNMEANRSVEGTGLGMSITRNLIRMMDGNIFISSEPGKGSTFTVHLPQGKVDSDVVGKDLVENLKQFRINSKTQMRRVQITREPMPYGSVLIVDDVEMNIFVAKGLLVPYGLYVDSGESGYAAIEKIKNGNVYDIIFMDHMMPEMDGFEATKIIREMGYRHPIVALTANAVAGQADIFLGNGFDDYLSKPVDIRNLNAVLNKFVRDKQPPEVIEAARKQAMKKEKQPGAAPKVVDNAKFAKFFIRDASKSIEALQAVSTRGTYGEEDIRIFGIHVHGMKSALAYIGKMEASALALKLEMAALERDMETVTLKTPEFLHLLEAFIVELSVKPEPADEKASEEDLAYLKEKLALVKAACEDYKPSAADEEFAKINEKTWSDSTREMLDAIALHLLSSEFDEVVEMINKFME